MIVQSHKVRTFSDRLNVIMSLINGGANIQKPDHYGNYPCDSIVWDPSTGSSGSNTSTNYTKEELEQLKSLLWVKVDDTEEDEPIPSVFDAVKERNVLQLRTLLLEVSSLSTSEYNHQTIFQYTIDELLQCIERLVTTTTTTTATTLDIHLEEIIKLKECIEILVHFGSASDPDTIVGTRQLLQQQQQKKQQSLKKSKRRQRGGGGGGAIPRINNIGNDDDDDDIVPIFHQLVCALRKVYQNIMKLQEQKDNNTTGIDNNVNDIDNKTIQILQSCSNAIETLVCTFPEPVLQQIPTDTKLLLYQGSRFNELLLVQFLIDKIGIDPNFVGPQQMTPLHFASRSGHINIVVSLYVCVVNRCIFFFVLVSV